MAMRSKIAFIVVGTALLAGTQASAGKPAPWPEYGVETSIPFANNGGIRNFEGNGDRGIWIEDRQRRWYYAKFIGNCRNLDYATGVGFDTKGSTNLDKFGAILVEGDYCQIDSLVTAEKPLPRKQRLKLRKEVREEGKKAVAPKD